MTMQNYKMSCYPPPLPSAPPTKHRFLKGCVIVIGGLWLIGTFVAPSEPQSRTTSKTYTFGGSDVDDIMQAAKTNEAKFERDYRGHFLGYVARFHSSNTTLGSRQVWFDNHKVVCHMSDASYLKTANWQPGSRVQVVGRMSRVGFMGTVALDDCEFIQ
jgi:hypothetical protein